MEYCNYIWVGVVQSPLSSPDWVQKRLPSLVADEYFSSLQPLSHINSLSLPYPYYYNRYPNELYYLVSQERTFLDVSCSRQTIPILFCVPFLKKKSSSP